MTISENTRDYFVVTKESYWSEEAGEVITRRIKVPTDKDFYYEWYRPIWAQRKRAQAHGECVCPRSELWKCDGSCEECEFRGAGEMLSLDYSYTDKKGNEVRPVDNLEDERETSYQYWKTVKSCLAFIRCLKSLTRKAAASVSWLWQASQKEVSAPCSGCRVIPTYTGRTSFLNVFRSSCRITDNFLKIFRPNGK